MPHGLRLSATVILAASCLAFPSRGADAPRTWSADEITPVTLKRVAALPEDQQPAWREYLALSEKLAALSPLVAAPEYSPEHAVATLPGAHYSRGVRNDAPARWYAGEEARAVADHVVTWQTVAGGWTKSSDYSIVRPEPAKVVHDVWSRGTFDNNATINELRFLARVISAAPADESRMAVWRGSFLRGLGYVFNAQYPNGGFPQIYPLGGGYHDAITYNDNAMGRVLVFLRDVSSGTGDYGFVPADLRAEAGRRFVRGIGCVLATQIFEESGRRTGWCQQHDALTLKPCPARNFEPAAVSTGESCGLVMLLMRQPEVSPEARRAIEAAVAWFEKVKIHDLVWMRENGIGIARAQAGAGPIWARLYEIGTDKPIFGDRDRSVHYIVDEISPERRGGYSWYSDDPAGLLRSYASWLKRQNKAR